MPVKHQRAHVKMRMAGSPRRRVPRGCNGGVHGLDLSEDELLRGARAVPGDGTLAEPAEEGEEAEGVGGEDVVAHDLAGDGDAGFFVAGVDGARCCC